MINSAIILLACGLTVVHSAKLNALDSKGDHKGLDFQSTIPSIMEGTTGMSHPENFAPLRLKSTKEEKTIMNDKKMSQISSHSFPNHDEQPSGLVLPHNSGLKTEQFQSGQQGFPPQSSRFDNFNGQFPNQDQFYDGEVSQQDQMFGDKQINEFEQFYGDNKNAPGQNQYYGHQEQIPRIYGNSQDSVQQREFFGNQQLTPDQQILYSGAQSKKSQEQVFNVQQQPLGEQQHFYNSGIQMGDSRGVHTASHMKSQTYADKQLFSMQTQGLSAFENRKQPLLMHRNALHSSSIIIPGLNRIPFLPALVYNSSPIPSSHAVASTKGAAVRQHLQTPYVRYVYSHFL